jgi:HK97 family phage major capsid protein
MLSTSPVVSPGDQIVAALLENPAQRRFEIERKAITVGPKAVDYIGNVIPGPVLPLRLRSIIPGGSTVASSIMYPRETSITNSPVVPITPGGAKPEVLLTYEVQERQVTTIPAYSKASRQAWEDAAMFRSWIDNRLMYSLVGAEEKQLLNGNGVWPQLEGLMLVALAVTTVTGGVNSLLDNVAAGIAATGARGYVVDGIVLNPGDWGKILTATATGVGYLLGPPALVNTLQSLWGIPLVLSPAMASGSYLVGQFSPYCQIFDREQASVEIAYENEDDLVKNMVTARAEERLVFAVYQPGAFSKGTFTP